MILSFVNSSHLETSVIMIIDISQDNSPLLCLMCQDGCGIVIFAILFISLPHRVYYCGGQSIYPVDCDSIFKDVLFFISSSHTSA